MGYVVVEAVVPSAILALQVHTPKDTLLQSSIRGTQSRTNCTDFRLQILQLQA